MNNEIIVRVFLSPIRQMNINSKIYQMIIILSSLKQLLLTLFINIDHFSLVNCIIFQFHHIPILISYCDVKIELPKVQNCNISLYVRKLLLLFKENGTASRIKV